MVRAMNRGKQQQGGDMTGEVVQIGDRKECPLCGERIKKAALVCRYCHHDLRGASKDNKGKMVKIRFKAGEKVYCGDIFLPENTRVSDMVNDGRRFLVLVNAVEERATRDVPIGFLALNKAMIEWIELKTAADESVIDHPARMIYGSV